MRLMLGLLVVALINWWLSKPTPEDPIAPSASDSPPRGSYAIDAMIFALCLLGVMYQKKREADRED